MLKAKVNLVLVCLICYGTTAIAMRCGTSLISEGDSEYDVISKCGEPLYQQTFNELINQYDYYGRRIGVIPKAVTKWIYQKSSAEFQYELIFEQGVLKKIKANRNP
jgi:hypothetical protein